MRQYVESTLRAGGGRRHVAATITRNDDGNAATTLCGRYLSSVREVGRRWFLGRPCQRCHQLSMGPVFDDSEEG